MRLLAESLLIAMERIEHKTPRDRKKNAPAS
jgi:hypothetical protein